MKAHRRAKALLEIKAKADAYTQLHLAFSEAFGFMLNRVSDAFPSTPDWHAPDNRAAVGQAEDACWNEFCLAVEARGIRLVGVRQ